MHRCQRASVVVDVAAPGSSGCNKLHSSTAWSAMRADWVASVALRTASPHSGWPRLQLGVQHALFKHALGILVGLLCSLAGL